jgi:hypothetical protein
MTGSAIATSSATLIIRTGASVPTGIFAPVGIEWSSVVTPGTVSAVRSTHPGALREGGGDQFPRRWMRLPFANPTNSTRLPFQRNFATLLKPIPLGQVDATPSPVHCLPANRQLQAPKCAVDEAVRPARNAGSGSI